MVMAASVNANDATVAMLPKIEILLTVLIALWSISIPLTMGFHLMKVEYHETAFCVIG